MEHRYSGVEKAPAWSGRQTYTAAGPEGRVFLVEAAGPEAGAAPFLFHQNLPEYLETLELALPGGARRCLAYRWFEAAPLSVAVAEGKTFAELEALNIAYEAARTLQYLHGLSPQVPHGAVRPDGVLLRGGRVALCPPLCAGSAEADIAGLADLMGALAERRKGARFSAQYYKIAEYLRLPGAGAGYAVKLMESFAARPLDELPAPKRPAGIKGPGVNWRIKLLAAAVGLAVFGAGVKLRFGLWPYLNARYRITADTAYAGKFPCARLPPLSGKAVEAQNLLYNPSLEGPCGWRRSWGTFRDGTVKKGGARAGAYYFEIGDAETVIYQDADVSGLAHFMKSGRCKVKLSGWLRAAGLGRDGEPYLYGYAMRSDYDYSYLSTCKPVRANKWTYSTCEFALPPGTQRVRLLLQLSKINGAYFSRSGQFDDLEVKVNCY